MTSQQEATKGQQFTFTNVLIIGDECMTNIALPDDFDTPEPTIGEDVKYVCTVGLRRGFVQISAVRQIDLSGRRAAPPSGQVQATPPAPPKAV